MQQVLQDTVCFIVGIDYQASSHMFRSIHGIHVLDRRNDCQQDRSSVGLACECLYCRGYADF